MKVQVKAKNQSATKLVKPTTASKAATIPAKAAEKTAKTKAKAPILKVVRQVLLIMSGKRGKVSRLGNEVTVDGITGYQALQDNAGLPIVGGICIPENGIITSKTDRKTRIELGGYVNGKNTGAKIEVHSVSAFDKLAKKGFVKWNVDSESVPCQFIGDISKKGCVAVKTSFNGKPFFWQVEIDSNPHNAHERGTASLSVIK